MNDTPWTEDHPMDANVRRCTARSKRTGQQCKRRPAVGRTVCAMHGGKSPFGPASATYQAGRYSKILPARLLSRYREASEDQELLALRSEIALIDSRLADVLSRVDTGESSRVWKSLAEAYGKLRTAQLIGDEVGARYALAALGELITRGRDDWMIWADVRQLVRERKALVESERKYAIESQYMIAVDQAMSVMGLLIDSVRRHVTDQDALRAITDEFARLTGVPSPTAAADC
jgi:hypothetical protein